MHRLSVLLITSALVLIQGCQSVPSATTESAMSPALATALREIGPVINGQATTALYAPLFADKKTNNRVSRNIAYGPHERHVLDISSNSTAGTKRPVVVFVHGGGFRGGAKSSPDSPFYDNIMNWAADQDMVGVSINYRLAPEYQWPSGIEDLTRVMSWLRANIASYGGDPEQIFLWGHSAGAAHVGDYLAWQAKYGLSDFVAGAVLTSGFYVLGNEVSIWSVYYGDNLTLYPERSALPGLMLTNTPLLINDAELDPENFRTDTQLLKAAYADAGKPLTYVYLQNHSHLSETYAVGTTDTSLSAPVRAFIRSVSGK